MGFKFAGLVQLDFVQSWFLKVTRAIKNSYCKATPMIFCALLLKRGIGNQWREAKSLSASLSAFRKRGSAISGLKPIVVVNIALRAGSVSHTVGTVLRGQMA